MSDPQKKLKTSVPAKPVSRYACGLRWEGGRKGGRGSVFTPSRRGELSHQRRLRTTARQTASSAQKSPLGWRRCGEPGESGADGRSAQNARGGAGEGAAIPFCWGCSVAAWLLFPLQVPRGPHPAHQVRGHLRDHSIAGEAAELGGGWGRRAGADTARGEPSDPRTEPPEPPRASPGPAPLAPPAGRRCPGSCPPKGWQRAVQEYFLLRLRPGKLFDH